MTFRKGSASRGLNFLRYVAWLYMKEARINRRHVIDMLRRTYKSCFLSRMPFELNAKPRLLCVSAYDLVVMVSGCYGL